MKNWKPEDIKQFREKYHLTAQALANLLGVTIDTVFKWQKGARKPNKTVWLLLERIEAELKSKMKGGEKHGKGNLQKK